MNRKRNRFSSLIKKEFDKVERRNFTDFALEDLCHIVVIKYN